MTQHDSIKHSEITFTPAIGLAQSDLDDFYRTAYPTRSSFLVNRWKWLYSGRNSENIESWPIVARVRSNRVIGHASTISTKINLWGTLVDARWFVDFFVLPEFRSAKVASTLIELVMESAPLVAILGSSDRGQSVFRRHGWSEHRNTTAFILPIRFSRHPRFHSFRYSAALNALDRIRLLYFQSKVRGSTSNYQLSSCSKDNIVPLIDAESSETPEFSQVHDDVFFQWRIFSSPMSKELKLYKSGHTTALFRLINAANYRRLNVLKVISDNPRQFCHDLLAIALDNNTDELSLFSSNNAHNRVFLKYFPIKKQAPLFLHSNNLFIPRPSPSLGFRLEMIDSDLDLIFPPT
jgi:hypothetical protein